MAGDVPTKPEPWHRLRITLGIFLAIIAGIMLWVAIKFTVLWLMFFGTLTAGAAFSLFTGDATPKRRWYHRWLDKLDP